MLKFSQQYWKLYYFLKDSSPTFCNRMQRICRVCNFAIYIPQSGSIVPGEQAFSSFSKQYCIFQISFKFWMSWEKSDYFIQTLHKFVEVHFVKIIFGHMWRLKSCQKQFSLAKSYNLQFSACSKTLYHLQQLRLSFSYYFWHLMCTCVWILIFLSCPF